MFRELSGPLSVQWEVTPWCNQRCLHCYNHWRQEGGETRKTTKETEILYRSTVGEILENQVMEVTITGGEPLAVLNEVLPYLQELNSKGVKLLLNSNLTLLTDRQASLMVETGITTVLTSLPASNPILCDEITRIKGSYERTLRGIQIAMANGIHPVVNMVVTKKNLPEVFATAKLVSKLGIKSFAATRAATPGNCPDFSPYLLSLNEFRSMLNELLRAREQLGINVDSLEFYPLCSFGNEASLQSFGGRMCTAGKTNCTIGFDGQVRPCSRAEQTYGNVCCGLRKAWGAMSQWRTNEWLPDECQGCNLKNKCAGGCKVDALRAMGNITRPDPFCDFSQLPVDIKKKPILQQTADTYSLNPKIRLRKEAFGGIIWLSSRRWVPASKELYALVFKKKGGTVTNEDLSQALGVTLSEAAKTASFLATKQILIPEDQKGEPCRRESYH